MIKFKLFGINFKISFLFLCLISFFLFYDKNEIFLSYLFFSMMHEMAHILTLKFFRVKIENINFKVCGIRIKKEKELPFLKEILVLISGCFCNLFFALFFLFVVKIKTIAIVNFLILIFNFLPFSNFDGGQILEMFLEKFLYFDSAVKICELISKLMFILIGGLFLVFLLRIKDLHFFWYYFFVQNKKFIFFLVLFLFSYFFEE